MPTYEFRCPDGTIIERVFKMSEVPNSIPSPNGDGMAERIISGGADLIFKGSGFYITDYGKDGKKDIREKSSESRPESSSSKSSSGESKSESSSAKSEARADTAGGAASHKTESKPGASSNGKSE